MDHFIDDGYGMMGDPSTQRTQALRATVFHSQLRRRPYDHWGSRCTLASGFDCKAWVLLGEEWMRTWWGEAGALTYP